MNSSNRIIKAQNVELIDSKEKLQPRFIKINFQTKEDNISKDNKDVEAEIVQIRKEAEEKIKIAKKEAYDRGFLEGLEKGIDQEKKKLSRASESITKIIKEFKVLKKEYFKNSEKDIIDLIFLIAKKVIHKEVTLSKDIIMNVLRDTMKNIHDKEDVKIRLNPKDYNYIMEANPNFVNNLCDIKIYLLKKMKELNREVL